jgi:hypothetical protein
MTKTQEDDWKQRKNAVILTTRTEIKLQENILWDRKFLPS